MTQKCSCEAGPLVDISMAVIQGNVLIPASTLLYNPAVEIEF